MADDIVAALADHQIINPFPIQSLAIPLALKDHDLIGQARTGTGKTMGFTVPILQKIDAPAALPPGTLPLGTVLLLYETFFLFPR